MAWVSEISDSIFVNALITSCSCPTPKWRWELATEIGNAENLIQDFYVSAEKDGLDRNSTEPLILREALDDGYNLIERRGMIYG